MVKQARAVKTREKLVSALERLLQTREFERIAVSEIAAEAGVAVGSVYSHFRNKDAFMEALLDEREARVRERLAQVDEEQTRRILSDLGSLKAAIDLVVETSFAQIRADEALIRATHHYIALNGGERGTRWQALRQQGQGGLTMLFDLYAEEIRRPDTRVAQDFFNMTLERWYLAMCLADKVSGAPSGLSEEDEKRELAAMLYAYLTQPGED